MLANNSSKTLREINPQNYADQQEVAGKTREQVRAELAEAKRDGLLDVHIEV